MQQGCFSSQIFLPSPTDSARGGGEMLLLRSRIWIQSWLSCWQGAQEAPAQLTVGQSLCIALWGGICGVWVSIEALLGHWGERVEL